MPSSTALLRKWNGWLDRIFHDQLADLLVNRHHFHTLRECVQPYQGSEDGAELCRWIVQGYLAFATTAIRRTVDRDRRSISFLNLLDDVLANHTILTIERHRRMYKRAFPKSRSHVAVSAAERAFAQITKNKRARVMSVKRIERDIRTLERASRIVRRYVNKVIAHTEKDRRRIGKIKHGHIDKAIDTLAELFKRYSLLIKGRCSEPLVPDEIDVAEDLQKVWPRHRANEQAEANS